MTYEVTRRGWLDATPWRAAELGFDGNTALGAYEGDSCALLRCDVVEGVTVPPKPLTESELIGLMDTLGIGTRRNLYNARIRIEECGYESVSFF